MDGDTLFKVDSRPMATLSPATVLDRTINQLIAKRRELGEQVAEIDRLFAKFGIAIPAMNGKRGPGRPRTTTAGASHPAAAPGKARRRRKRGTFSRTAEDLILSVVPASTSEINKTWKGEGRGGTADNTLSLMVKKRLLKRSPNKDGRGSTYAKA